MTVMEGGLTPVSARLGRALIVAVLTAALLCMASVGAPDASAKGKKIHACVVKKGKDKGAMRFSRNGRCHKGEKRISWSKKGKKGKRGKPGPAGPKGEAGPQGSSGVTDELLATIAAQQAQIDQLTAQLASLTQQLGALSPTVAALCSQVTEVTSQSDALQTVIGGISALPLAGLTIPGLPPALGAFSCP
jgi:uncharacterized coiled-coil protein SlyX